MYCVKAGNGSIFNAPCVAWIKDRDDAITGIEVYFGNELTVKRSMLRNPNDTVIGNVPIQTGLALCEKTGVKRAIFTHLGSQIVEWDEEEIHKKLLSKTPRKKCRRSICCPG